MVAELKMQAEEVTRASVIERVEAYINGGMTPNQAFVDVFEEIERAGDLEALARLHGSSLVGMIWRAWNIEHRPPSMARRLARPLKPALVLAPLSGQRAGRVHDPEVIREALTMDSRYKLDGSWVRLGGMDRAACLKVFAQYRAAAISKEHSARHLRLIAESLGEGETVEQKFSEADLLRMFKASAPAGNTLK